MLTFPPTDFTFCEYLTVFNTPEELKNRIGYSLQPLDQDEP